MSPIGAVVRRLPVVALHNVLPIIRTDREIFIFPKCGELAMFRNGKDKKKRPDLSIYYLKMLPA